MSGGLKSGIGEEQSLLTRNKEGMRKNIPNDLGLLPGMCFEVSGCGGWTGTAMEWIDGGASN